MNRILKVFIVLIAILICPNIYALEASSNTNYPTNKSNLNYKIDKLDFTNMKFSSQIVSGNDEKFFGIEGKVHNEYNMPIDFTDIISFYNSKNEYIAAYKSNSSYHLDLNETIDYSFLMRESAFLLGHSSAEIAYYTLTVEVNSSYDYTINGYDVNIKVNENNTFDISENINAYFNVEKHGIYRTLPIENNIIRLDGTTSTNHAKITNLKVNNEYTTSFQNNMYKIKIGSADKTLTGEQAYVISYNYNIGKDPLKNADELYYNIIGTNWDTTIDNVTFTITLPKSFDKSKLGFSAGPIGSTDNSKVRYTINGNTISGKYNGTIDPGEALTIRLTLDEGYFKNANISYSIYVWLIFLIPTICLAIIVLLWLKYGKDNRIIDPISFYPPDGLNSLQIASLYKGKADNSDVISLLIYLASKGYIKISDAEKKSVFYEGKNFKITKLKEYDGTDLNEKLFLNDLFTIDNEFKYKILINGIPKGTKSDQCKEGKQVNEITLEDLHDDFYISVNKILRNVNSKENKNKIFEKHDLIKLIIVILISFISLTVTLLFPLLDTGNTKDLFIIAQLIIMLSPFILIGFVKNNPLIVKISSSFIGIFCLIGFFYVSTYKAIFSYDAIYLLGYILGIIIFIAMMIFANLMPKRTKYGNEMLGKIRGFKRFLETAEKEKIEELVEKNPEYFYDILPYSYVLGVSNKWIKRFETIALEPPTWYDSTTDFSIDTFDSFFSSTMSSAQSSMGGSSSGGSSGGGSSGGGSGGGGGGSW